MFNLSRYFSTLSFILIVLAAGGLGLLYRELSLRQMSELAESHNMAMAQIFENGLRDAMTRLIASSVGRDADFLRQSEDVGELRGGTIALMHDTAVIKVKIYSRLGITLFSTDASQIGESRLDSIGFRSAMSGEVFSKLSHRSSMNAFEGARTEIDVLET